MLTAATVVVPAVFANAQPAGAATFSTYTVNSTTDSTDAAGTGLCATQPPTTARPCTLRAAIAEANALSGVTIKVPAGVYNLTAGSLAITKPMTIVGAEAQPGPNATTIDGGAKDRVFRVTATGVTIDGVVIRNGKTKSNDGFGGDDNIQGDGGGILVSTGANLTLVKSTVSGNTAVHEGGAIDVDAPTTIKQSTISGNTASSNGGGVTSDSTLTIENSTITGNTSSANGGGVWANGTTTVRASTITANKATGSNSGGGLYRKSGTVTVSGSIIAGNTATTGPDCNGAPTFSGTNIVQTTTACSPAGTAPATGDPKLGALADNGGPTLTQRPQSGSPAIDAYAATGSPAACLTATDQRGVARPQPTGGKCDLGAQEVLALGLDLSLSASSPTIPVGTATVPLPNIPQSALLPPPAGTSATQGLPYKFTPYKFTTYKFLTYKFLTYKFLPYKFTPYKFTTYKFLTYKFLAAETLLTAAGIKDPLATIPLTDVTLDLPGGWPAFLANTQFGGVALNTLTFAQVVPILEASNVTIDQIDFSGTPLGSIPYIAPFLGGTPLRSIPLTTQLESATDAQRLAQWCANLQTANPSANPDPCTALGHDPNLTLLAVSLAGYNVDGIGLDQVLVRDVAGPDSATFANLSLAGFAAIGSSLGTIPVGSLPAGYVTCAATTCPTLADAAAIGGIDPNKTLLDLFTDQGAAQIPQIATFTLPALITALLPPDYQQWQTIDIGSTPLQNDASPLQPVETYTMSLNVKGDRPAATTVKLVLPAGFVIAPGTFILDGATQADPSVDLSTNTVTLTLGTLAPGPHTAALGARAGLNTGPTNTTANATATAGTDVVNATASSGVQVTEAFKSGGIGVCSDTDPCSQTLQPDVLYVGHISSPTDRDYYRFNVPNNGQKTHASIILSNLPIDADLVLYGPATVPLLQGPEKSVNPVNDTGLSLYPSGDHVSPDTVQDVPLTPPSYAPGVIQISAQRGTVDEQIDTGTLAPGDYAVQVSGYNGAFSALPYTLRMSLIGATPPPCAAAPARAFADGGSLADVTTLGSDPHVLFVVPQHRLYQTYGAARVDPLMAKLNTLATNVGGTILAVDNPDTTAAPMYAAWDQNRCSPKAANDVVREVARQITAARQANPAIDSVVIVGGDPMVPMARISDRTRIANEAGYGDALVTASGGSVSDNELSGSLGDGNLLTDDVYGSSAGISVNDHELFVPDVALGRLVESPEDIANAMQTYLDNNGTLDVSTASSALVTGMDFTIDGANGVASALTKNGVTNVDSSLISNSWTATDLQNKLLPASGSSPGIVSFNGHFDQTHMLAGDGRTVLNSSVLADPANAGKLARHLLFSMGCHSGLSVDDVSIGTQLDWPQAFTGTDQSALYAANTGYGYGDDTSVALGERLMGLYAQSLDGKVSVGRALMIAKQQYYASTEVLNPYDEKVTQESVFYGLPFYKLSAPLVHTALRKTSVVNGGSSVTISGTDPSTGLPVAPLDVSLTLPGAGTGPNTFNENDTPHGTYFDVNGETIQVQSHPIEPSTSVDVSQTDPNTGKLARRAHGVLITALSSVDRNNLQPDYFLPKLDQQGNEQLLAPVGDAVFPSALSNVTSAIGENGDRDNVTLTAGQFRDPTTNGNGTQRFFNHIGGIVEYSSLDDTDFTAPTILRSSGEIVNGTAGFTVFTDGTAKRVLVLFKAQGSNGDWKSAELTPTPQTDGSIQWWGGAPASTPNVEFAVEAVDGSGNVGLSNNKVSNFVANTLQNSGSSLSVAITPVAGPSGWIASAAIANVTAPSDATVQYSLDGGPITPFPVSGGVQISGSGIHHILTFDSPEGDFAAGQVSIDADAPRISAAIDPQGNATFTDPSSHTTWYGGPVALTMTADDGGGGSGVQSITYSATGALSVGSTTASGPPGLVRSPLGTASATVTVNPSTDGATQFSYSATDNAGNSSPTGSTTINIDTTPPNASCQPSTSTSWLPADVTVNCTVADAGSGLANASDGSFSLATMQVAGTQGTVSTPSRKVCDNLNNCTTVGPFTFQVDEQAPTINATIVANGVTSAVDGSGQKWFSGPVSLQLAADDTGGSGVASITYGESGTLHDSGTVDTASTTLPIAPDTDGLATVTYSASDVAANTSPQGSTTIGIDRKPPDPTCTVPDPHGVYHADVTVNCTATDTGVGLASAGDASFSLSTALPAGTQSAAALTATKNLCDALGNCVTVGPFSFAIDEQKPTITGTIVPNGATSASDGSGHTWWNAPVSLELDASDGTDGNGSGVASIAYSSTGAFVSSGSVSGATTTIAMTTPSNGSTTFSYSATDVAGNTSPQGSTTINVDANAPAPTCTYPDPNAWYKTDVTANCTASDTGVGLANPADASFSLTTAVPAGTQSANAMTGSKLLCDKLNNCVTVGPFSFKVDKQVPTIAITTPANGATYQQAPTPVFSCSDGSGGSGIAATNGCVATAINPAVGSHTFTINALDVAGNTATSSVTYSIGYQVCLLYNPTTPQANYFAFRLQLCDSTGKNLSSSSIVLKAVYIDKPGNAPPINDGCPTDSLNFSFISNAYQYCVDKNDAPKVSSGSHNLYFTVNGASTPVYAMPFTLK